MNVKADGHRGGRSAGGRRFFLGESCTRQLASGGSAVLDMGQLAEAGLSQTSLRIDIVADAWYISNTVQQLISNNKQLVD